MNLKPGMTLICTALAASFFAQDARATLGEAAESIVRDGIALSTVTRTVSARAKYSVQEISSGTTTVREYLTPTGVVFAVGWNGLVRPDLSVLLGTYNLEYRDAAARQTRKMGRRQTQVTTNRLIVQTWGHMRNLQGRAYLPDMVPEGVDLYEIR